MISSLRSTFLALLLAAFVAGCAMSATRQLADGLDRAILDQDDPATVRAGAPAYLLLLDGLLQDRPDDPQLLLAAARLYGTYAEVFVDEPERARRLGERAFRYARHALCDRLPSLCGAETGPFEAYAAELARLQAGDLPAAYVYATTWTAWIEARRGDWGAVAQLARVQALLQRLVELDEGYDHGRAHLYLAALHTLLPPALGGRAEEGRRHFERAIALSEGRDLTAKVEFARRYARLVYDRHLHDRLLSEVLAADPAVPGLTLANTIARQEAAELLRTAADHFPEAP